MTKKRHASTGAPIRVPLAMLSLGVAIAGIILPLHMRGSGSLVQDARSMLADAGASLSAAVPSNPYNTVAEQLYKKEAELNAREAMLAEMEQGPGFSVGELFGFVSFALSLIILLLLGLNFYLDSLRNRKGGLVPSRLSVDLR